MWHVIMDFAIRNQSEGKGRSIWNVDLLQCLRISLIKTKTNEEILRQIKKEPEIIKIQETQKARIQCYKKKLKVDIVTAAHSRQNRWGRKHSKVKKSFTGLDTTQCCCSAVACAKSGQP